MASSPVVAPAPVFLRRQTGAQAAYEFALRAHGGQTRAHDGAAFVEHPLEVAELLDEEGSSSPLVVAALLHDTVERTGTELAQVTDQFGAEVAALVAATTEDPAIRSYSRRKGALREQVRAAGGPAAELFAADKLSKVREFRVQLDEAERGGRLPRSRRLLHYRRSLETVEEVIPDHPLVVRLRAEVTEVEALARNVYAGTKRRGLSR